MPTHHRGAYPAPINPPPAIATKEARLGTVAQSEQAAAWNAQQRVLAGALAQPWDQSQAQSNQTPAPDASTVFPGLNWSYKGTVSGYVPYRARGDNPATGVAPYPAMPNRALYFPSRGTATRTTVHLQALRNVMRNALGCDARINENLTMNVPAQAIPMEMGGALNTLAPWSDPIQAPASNRFAAGSVTPRQRTGQVA